LEAGLLFEETKGTLLCSDLFHQNGDVEPRTETDIIDRARKTLIDYQAGPFANYMPYTKHTDGIMQRLADLKPQTIAPMHGSAYFGNGSQAIIDLAAVMREVLG
jgi:flavorubredoxin